MNSRYVYFSSATTDKHRCHQWHDRSPNDLRTKIVAFVLCHLIFQCYWYSVPPFLYWKIKLDPWGCDSQQYHFTFAPYLLGIGPSPGFIFLGGCWWCQLLDEIIESTYPSILWKLLGSWISVLSWWSYQDRTEGSRWWYQFVDSIYFELWNRNGGKLSWRVPYLHLWVHPIDWIRPLRYMPTLHCMLGWIDGGNLQAHRYDLQSIQYL